MPECADPVVDLKIEEKIVHSRYDQRNGENDIALLRLEKNVNYTGMYNDSHTKKISCFKSLFYLPDYIKPICLKVKESAEPQPKTEMYVVGWGATENSKITIVNYLT